MHCSHGQNTTAIMEKARFGLVVLEPVATLMKSRYGMLESSSASRNTK